MSAITGSGSTPTPSGSNPPSTTSTGTTSTTTDSISSASVDYNFIPLTTYSQGILISQSTLEQQLGANDYMNYLVGKLRGVAWGELASSIFQLSSDLNVDLQAGSAAILELNQANSTLYQATVTYNQQMSQDKTIQDPITNYDNAVSLGASTDISATSSLNTAIGTYNTALSDYQTATNTYNAGAALYANGSITQAVFQSTYVIPYNIATATYNTATNTYNTALSTYQSYVDTRNQSLASYAASVNQAVSSDNQTIDNWNTTITNLNNSSIPTIPSLPTASSLPDAPSSPTPLPLPNLTLSVPNRYQDMVNWMDQVIDLRNNGSINSSEFNTLKSIYNQFINNYNSDHSTDILNYDLAVSDYNAIVNKDKVILQTLNAAFSVNGSGVVSTIPSSVSFDFGFSQYTHTSLPLPQVSLRTPIPEVLTVLNNPYAGLNAYQIASLSESIPTLVSLLTQLSLGQSIKKIQDYYTDHHQLFFNIAVSPNFPPSYTPVQRQASGEGGQSASQFGLLTTSANSPHILTLLSNASFEKASQESIAADVSPGVDNQFATVASSLISHVSLASALATLSILSGKLGSVNSEGPSVKAAFSLSFATLISGSLPSISQQIQEDPLKAALLNLGILDTALSAISQNLGLPGLSSQILGGIPGISKESVIQASNENPTFNATLENPVTAGFVALDLTSLLKDSGLNPALAQGIALAVVQELLQSGIPNSLEGASATISGVLANALSGGTPPDLGNLGAALLEAFANNKQISFSQALQSEGGIAFLKEALGENLINQGFSPLAAGIISSFAVDQALQSPITQQADFATALTKGLLGAYPPEVSLSAISSIATNPAAFIQAERTLSFLDAAATQDKTFRELRDAATQNALQNLKISRAEAFSQANQEVLTAFNQKNQTNTLAENIQRAGINQTALLETLSKELQQHGVSQENATALVSQALLTASQNSQGTQAADVFRGFLATALVDLAKTNFSQISLSVAEEFAKNIQEVNAKALESVKQQEILGERTLHDTFVTLVASRLEKELGKLRSQELAEQLSESLFGSSTSLRNQIATHLSTLKEQSDQTAFNAYVDEIHTILLPTLSIFKFNDDLNDPAQKLSHIGIMYDVNKSLSAYKEISIAV